MRSRERSNFFACFRETRRRITEHFKTRRRIKKNRKELEKPIDPDELILTEEEISDLSDLQKERRYGAVLPDDHILLLQKHRNAKRILYYLANLHGSKMHLPKSSNTDKGKVSKFIKSFFPQ